MTDLLDKLLKYESIFLYGRNSGNVLHFILQNPNFSRQYVAELIIYFRYYRVDSFKKVLSKCKTVEELRKRAMSSLMYRPNSLVANSIYWITVKNEINKITIDELPGNLRDVFFIRKMKKFDEWFELNNL